MSDLIQTRLNTNLYSAASCSWLINAIPYEGITALSYSDKRERALVFASRKDGKPLGVTGGQYQVDSLSITMLRASANQLMLDLTPVGLGSFGNADFPIVATYSEVAAQLRGEQPIVVVINGCRITGVKEGFATGTDALITEFTLMALSLTRNGMSLANIVAGV